MGVSSLILTVTRRCNLRCSYCPTAKDGWPSLNETDAVAALDLFESRFGGGDIKLFGGEPLLVPDVVRRVITEASTRPAIRRIYLSTNGLGLDHEWLALVRRQPKVVLTLSLDGRPDDHRAHRRALPQVPDAYAHVNALRQELLATPRVVVTQTIAPATAAAAHENFLHLLGLGFRRFNLLPGYYLPWKETQLMALRRGFAAIGETIEAEWADLQHLYLRNLFTWAPTPFFNSGVVVDSDRSIHASNAGLSGALESLLDETRLGDLDAPPSREALQAKSRQVNGLLERTLPPAVWRSTLAVDAELSQLCRSLYPALGRYRRARARNRGEQAA
jgi:Radical SAM superfamily